MDSVKQSAALCLLRLYKTSPDLVLMGEWTSRVVHLLNDQHMVSLTHRKHNLMMFIHMPVYIENVHIYRSACFFVVNVILRGS